METINTIKNEFKQASALEKAGYIFFPLAITTVFAAALFVIVNNALDISNSQNLENVISAPSLSLGH